MPDARVHLVFGVMADKDWQSMVPELGPLCKSVTLTAPQVRRAAPPETLLPAWSAYAPVRVVEEPVAALEAVLAECSEDDTVVVTGSLFLVGAVRSRFASATRKSEKDCGQQRVAD
jgi:dihydrofolate synthase/folylpolyglutamate synthase